MKRILLAVLSAAALAAITSGVTVTPAEAHHPSYIWYNGYKYWAADYYRQRLLLLSPWLHLLPWRWWRWWWRRATRRIAGQAAERRLLSHFEFLRRRPGGRLL